MTFDHVDRFVSLASAGGGLLLAGGLTRLAGDRPRSTIAIVAASAGLSVGAAAAWTASLTSTGLSAVVLAGVLLPGLLLASRRLSAARVWAVRTATRPAFAAALGVTILVGSIIVLDHEENEEIAGDLEETDLYVLGMPPARKAEAGAALTERGARLELSSPAVDLDPETAAEREAYILSRLGAAGSFIRRGPADERTNCFGWVFAHGRFWLTDQSVGPILSDNGYHAVTDPRPGDLVIYRDRFTGRPAHAALVRYVTEGQPVLVEGKWGWVGVFLHEVDRSSYGTAYTYYRSPRTTHQLALTGVVESGPDGPLTGAE